MGFGDAGLAEMSNPVPSYRMYNAGIGCDDYCAYMFAYTHGALLLPTYSWVGNWLYLEPTKTTYF